MARTRNLKPEFFLNQDLGELSPYTRLLFAGLWCMADREGRLEDRPKRIKVGALPYDDVDIDALLQELHNTGMIQRYEVDGKRYIQITNFAKHQTPHAKESPSAIPAPTFPGKAREIPVQAREIPGQAQEIPVQAQEIPGNAGEKIPLTLNPYTLTLNQEAAYKDNSSYIYSEEAPSEPATATDAISDTLKLFAENTQPRYCTEIARSSIVDWCDKCGPELVQAAIRSAAKSGGKVSWGWMERRLIELYEAGCKNQADVDAHMQKKSKGVPKRMPDYSKDDGGIVDALAGVKH